MDKVYLVTYRDRETQKRLVDEYPSIREAMQGVLYLDPELVEEVEIFRAVAITVA